jgi:hypothetical protein
MREQHLLFLEDVLPVIDALLHTRRELWMLQNDAHPHFGSQESYFLNQYFQNRSTGRQGPFVGHTGHMT